MIKVLIVEDSRTAQEFLVHALTSDPEIEVVGIANDGVEAQVAVREKRPDVITMDIHMPKMDGYEATREIMETIPTPIVMVSASTSIRETASTFRAIEAGALAVVFRPPGIGQPGYEKATRELVRTLKTMSEIKLVKRIPSVKKKAVQLPEPSAIPVCRKAIQLVAIGASTGGPPVLQKILAGLPADYPFPVLIVQHIAPGFVAGFVEWLGGASHFPVQVAADHAVVLPGHAYIAPDGCHMGITNGQRITLSPHAPENGLRPAVSYLFRTVAQVVGSRAVGVLLTGMGKDGAEEMKFMKDCGAITIAQDEASSVVHGMPGEAIKLGGVAHVLSPTAIISMLVSIAEETRRAR